MFWPFGAAFFLVVTTSQGCPCSEITSYYRDGERQLVYQISENHFAYQPIFTPVTSNSSSLVIKMEQFSSHWRTSFALKLDDDVARYLAYDAVLKILTNTSQMLPLHVYALPVSSVNISIPDIFEEFPNVTFVSHRPCSERVACYRLQRPTSKIRITIASSKKTAIEMKNLIQSTEVFYEVHYQAFMKDIRSKQNPDGITEREQNCFDALRGSVDMAVALSGFSEGEKETSDLNLLEKTLALELLVNKTAKDQSEKLEFLELKLMEQLQQITKNLSATCNQGWEKFCDETHCACYKVLREKVDWQSAASKCLDYGSKLASIHSHEENDFVGELVLKVGSGDYWIGYSDIELEGIFKWQDETITEYTNWSQGQPNHYLGYHDGGDCIVMSTDVFNEWVVTQCSLQNPRPICKVYLESVKKV